MNLIKLLEWALISIRADHPLYGALVSVFPISPVRMSPVLQMSTDGSLILFNQNGEGIDKFTIKRIIGLMLTHIMLGHVKQMPTVERPDLYRMAQEFEAEMWTPHALGETLMTVPEYHLMTLLRSKGIDTCDRIYRHLLESEHLPAPWWRSELQIKGRPPVDQDMLEFKLLQAYQLALSYGSVPAEYQQLLESLRQPRVDWRSRLERLWFQTAGRWKLDLMHPHPVWWGVHGVYAPSLRPERQPKVVLAIDTSDSMSGEPLREVLSEIRGLAHKVCNVLYMISDCKIHHMGVLDDSDYEGLEDVIKNLRGKGGTSFIPVFDEVEHLRWIPDLLVYTTDLCGSYPDWVPGYPVVWLTTNKTAEVPFGEVIIIPEDEVRK